MTTQQCDLCLHDGGDILVHTDKFRVVLVDDANYPGFCRVIWQHHIKEMTDLCEQDRLLCMKVVFAVEQAVRTVMQPEKINLASLGNMTPHVHWHVIPRYADDKHFPDSVWSVSRRDVNQDMLKHRIQQLNALKEEVKRVVSAVISA